VGVIANLAVWLSLHFAFREIEATRIAISTFLSPDWFGLQLAAYVLTLMACVLLLRAKLGVLPLLGASAVLGLLEQTLPLA
jgi:chromate transporter